MKIILNRDYGAFSLSLEQANLLGFDWVNESNKDNLPGINYDELRTNPLLISSVEAGDKGGNFAALEVFTIPDDSFYLVKEFDGLEFLFYSASPLKMI